MTVKELREKAGKLADRIKELARQAEGREFTAEEKENWEKLNKEYNDLLKQIERAELVEQLDRDMGDPQARNLPGREDTHGTPADDSGRRQVATDEQRALALQAWMRTQSGLELTEPQREAAAACELNPGRRELTLRLFTTDQFTNRQRLIRHTHPGVIERALSVNTGASGGFIVPSGFINRVEDALLFYGGMRQVAEILRTETGEELSWPTDNDTSNSGERLGEGQAVTEAAPTFGQVKLNAYVYSSKLVRVPVSLLQDAAFDLVNWLAAKLGERISRAQNSDYTTGIRGNQPWGIVTAATLGVTAAAQAAIDWDELKQLIHSVDVAYRTGARWMFHDNTALALRQIRDGMGREIWQSNAREGLPDTIEGYPVTLNNDMASTIATTAKTIIFGQLTKYKIRDVQIIIVRRLVERYAEYNEEGFVAFMRSDGALIDAGTHPVKYLQQA